MKGLLYKDFLTQKATVGKLFFTLIFLFLFLFALGQSPAQVLITCVTLLTVMAPSQSFWNDHTSKWNALVLSMPLKRKTLVLARFAFAFISVLIAATAVVVPSVYLLQKTWRMALIIGAAYTVIIMLILSIILSAHFIFGPEKSRIITPFATGSLPVAFMIFYDNASPRHIFSNLLAKTGIIVAVILGLVMLSIWFFEKKEF